MSNFLDLRCPNCGDQDWIDILAEIWVRATDDGTDPDQAADRDWTYTPSSTACCASCGHRANLSSFEPEAEALS